jgi:DNA polymerase III epsilon subunit-like protein
MNEDDRLIVVDVETTNSIDDPICYDVGFAVIDPLGNVYETYSYVVADVFLDKELMSSAFFIDKVPQYWDEIKAGQRQLKTFYNIKKSFSDCIKRNKVKIIIAHNAGFDYRALNLTQRYITSSKRRFFLPYGIKVWDTLKMSRAVLKDSPLYDEFCYNNQYLTKRMGKRYTAEIIYRFLSGNNSFEEKHTGLEDVLIEKEIFAYCLAKNPEINGALWED